jgi:histidinol-phosphate aminotransferase
VYNYLVLNKIISRNRTTQPLCENCIRITIGTKGENDLMLEKVKEL